MNKHLAALRKELDEVDNTLLHILAKRMEIVSNIGKLKKIQNIPPLDKARWDEVVKTRTEIGKQLGLTEEFIITIWNTIHKESLKKEEQV